MAYFVCFFFAVNRMASTFFVSRNVFVRSEHFVVFHVPSDRCIQVLNLTFSKGVANNMSTDSPILSEIAHISSLLNPSIKGNAAVPFLVW